MVSSNLLISSSPTPAHQLHHPFRHFEPHPSPLSSATVYRQRNHLNHYPNQEDHDDECFNSSMIASEEFIEVDDHQEEYNQEHEEEEDEEDEEDEEEGEEYEQDMDAHTDGDYHEPTSDNSSTSEGDQDLDIQHDYHHQDHIDQLGQASFGDYDQNQEDEDELPEDLSEQLTIGTVSPSLDASFASSMSIVTAPPTPSNDRLRNPFTNIVRPRSFVGHHSPLPAHLFVPNPNALPPSSSPHRMDISPAPASSRLPIPSNYSHQASGFQPHSPDDPFGGAPSRDSRRIPRRSPSRSKLASDLLFHNSFRAQPEKLSPRSLAPPSDGMDIDSPGYAQPRHCDHLGTLGSPVDSDDQSPTGLQFPQRPTRSTSEGSTGKRSRSDEGEEREQPSRPSSSGSHTRQPFTSESRASIPAELSAALPRPTHSNIFSGPAHPPGQGSHSFSPYYASSSPNQMISPSVKAAAKMTIGRKAGERSLSGFRFPPTRSQAAATNDTSSTRHQHYGMGSLGAASGSGTTLRRPTLGVVQSSATLFGCPQSLSTNNIRTNRQRDAIGRPASKSRRAISFAATEGDNLNFLLQGGSMITDPDEDDEESELDVSSVFNCSPAPRTSNSISQPLLVSKTWPKYAESPIRPNRRGNNPRSKFNLTRQVSCAPMGSSSLAPPNANSGLIFQSPTRVLVATLGSTIESPVGMAFSEKERAGKILPCHKVSNDGLMRISPDTMDQLLEGVYDDNISSKIIIDCRFSYEYEGGHIRAAINIHDKKVVDNMLLRGELFKGGKDEVPLPSESGKRDLAGQTKKVVVVFHCEYSAMRAPTVAKYLREKDRHMNMPHYPALHYPEVYILEGGYARYHAHSPHHCDGDYVRMDDPSHRHDRHADLNQFRTRESSIFSRAKSFTYGESKKTTHKHLGLTKKSSFSLAQQGTLAPAKALFGGGKENMESSSHSPPPHHYGKIDEEDEEDLAVAESDEACLEN